ncbi:alpha/beta hydrolase [Candidatus Woesearchaeota archaeon]|nr:alpha/beta hydrolase [Candidatus Woesearchaeota archaeon]
MKLFGFNFGQRDIQDIVKEIGASLPAELEKEEELADKLKRLAVFLGSEKEKKIEGILSSGKDFLSGWNLPPNLQGKFSAIVSYPFYQDFLKNKNLAELEDNLASFSENPDLYLTESDISIIISALEYDLERVRKLNIYFAELDYILKDISVPIKLIKRRGAILAHLYEELLRELRSEKNRRYIKGLRKEDVANTTRIAYGQLRVTYRKLEEFYLLQKIVKIIDEQRILTRKARRLSFNYRNDEALECIESIKKAVPSILSDEIKRISEIAAFEESSADNGDGQRASVFNTNIPYDKIVLRKNKAKSIRRALITLAILFSSYGAYGTSISFALSSMPPPGPASAVNQAKAKSILPIYTYTQNPINAKVPKQDIQIKTEFGSLKGWFFRSNDSDKIVIVTHAIFHNKSWEAPLIEVLTGKGYNVIAFDFPGHGENDWKMGSISYGINESKIVLEVLKKAEDLGYREAVLVGQSMGAASSVKAAANYDGGLKIKGIAAGAMYASLMDSFYKVGQEKFGIWKWLTHFGTWLGGLVTGVNYSSFDSRPDIRKLNEEGVPIFYHYGEKDDKLSPNVVKPIKELAKPSDTIKVYESRGHTFYWGDERAERDKDVADFILSHMSPA